MIDRDRKLPLARQAKAVGISRGSIYYRPRPVGEAGLGLMRRINELHLEYPFAGSRMMRGLLRQEGLSCGRRHIATLMRRMGIDALYRKPNTSRRRPGHVDGQRKCPAKWPAKMSLVLLAMITDGSYSTRSRFMGGLRASMYFFAVSRWMPSSRATPRVDNPLRFAF